MSFLGYMTYFDLLSNENYKTIFRSKGRCRRLAGMSTTNSTVYNSDRYIIFA